MKITLPKITRYGKEYQPGDQIWCYTNKPPDLRFMQQGYFLTEDQAEKILGALELGKVGVGFSIDECKMSDQDESYIDEAIAIMTGGLDNEKT